MTETERDTPHRAHLDAANKLWADYLASHPQHDHDLPPTECFGDSADLADELLDLVLTGPKRATAALVAEFDYEDEPLPRIGGHWVAHDGDGEPKVVLRTTELRLGPLSSVDEQFAWDEGEGDRTLDWWLREHRRYFQRCCERLGIDFDDSIEVVFERFRVVWPREHADA